MLLQQPETRHSARRLLVEVLYVLHEQAACTGSWCSGSCRAAFRSAICRPLPKMGTGQRMTLQQPMTPLDQTRTTRCAWMLTADDEMAESCRVLQCCRQLVACAGISILRALFFMCLPKDPAMY
jgi:hypothetical protein